MAVTNCLNFASPERPEVMGSFAAAVDGMAAACQALGLPVTGGNVSFYNESSGRPIHPTPVVGVLGLLADPTTAVPSGFPRPGLDVWLLGETRVELGGSAWQRLTTARLEGRPPSLDLAAEASLHRLLTGLAGRRLLAAAHDLSDGGLAVALVEATLAAGVGATLDLPEVHSPGDDTPAAQLPLAALVSESASRALVAVAPEASGDLTTLAAEAGVPATHLGATGGDRLVVPGVLDLPSPSSATPTRAPCPAPSASWPDPTSPGGQHACPHPRQAPAPHLDLPRRRLRGLGWRHRRHRCATTTAASGTTAAASPACADAAALKASMAELDGIDPPEASKAGIQAALEKVSTNLAALKASAKSQWSSQITALDSAVESLKTTIAGISGNSLASALPTVLSDLQRLDIAWTALLQQVDQDCG